MNQPTRHRIPLAFYALLIAALVLSACATATAPTGEGEAPAAAEDATAAPAEEAAEPAATDGSVLRFGYSQRPNNFNPLTIIQGIQGFTAKWVFGKLVTFDADGNVIGDLATDWTISDDGTVFTFTLRDDVTWHDGEPFNAEDVVFTFNYLLNPDTGAQLYSNFQIIAGAPEYGEGATDSVSGVEALSDTEVQITLSEPSAIFLVDLAQWNGARILPEHVVSQIAPEEFATSGFATERPYPGTGPYVFERYETDQFFELSANPDYYRGAPQIDRIRVLSIPDANTRIIALENAEVDLIQGIPTEEYARVSELDGVQVIEQPSPTVTGLFVDSDDSKDDPKKAAMRTPEFRQALYHALDMDALINDVQEGLVTRQNCVFIQEWACASDLTDYAYNPDAARELLAEIGWDESWEVDWMILSEQVEPLHAVMQQMFADVGLNMVVRTVDGPTFVENFYSNGTFDVTLVGYGAGVDPNVPANNFFVCGQLYPNGYNGTRYCNDQVSDLVKQGQVTTDPDERAAIYQELSLILNAELPLLPLWISPILTAARDNVNLSYQQYDWDGVQEWTIE